MTTLIIRSCIVSCMAVAFGPLHGEDLVKIEPAWTDPADGWIDRGEYIDIDIATKDRLFIRYCAISDSGVQLERTKADVVIWRKHVQNLGVAHSKYTHHVQVRVWREVIYIESAGAEFIYETRNLKDGSLINREIRARSKPNGSFLYQKESDLSNERAKNADKAALTNPLPPPS